MEESESKIEVMNICRRREDGEVYTTDHRLKHVADSKYLGLFSNGENLKTNRSE